MSPTASVLVHLLTFNSGSAIFPCIEALLAQTGFTLGETLEIQVTDNASSDNLLDELTKKFGPKISVFRNQENLGFCGGHNQGAQRFLRSNHNCFLVLNPDVKLEASALHILAQSLLLDPNAGSACPRLLRCDEDLNPLEPSQLDAAGMYLNSSFRHFDRGSGKPDTADFQKSGYVFGASGACLLLKRDCVSDLVLSADSYEQDVNLLYPALALAREDRALLFDEAFFAYREDADLAFRAQYQGWKCLYQASSIGYHKRVVVPERRGSLSPILNLLGVRNRFLLEINNFSLDFGPGVLFFGIILRNLLVLLAVVLRERSSLPAFGQVLKLRRRGFDRRQVLKRRRRVSPSALKRWFADELYIEPLTTEVSQ